MSEELDVQQPELEQEKPAEAPALFDDEDQESQEQEAGERAATEGDSPSLKEPARNLVSDLRKEYKSVVKNKRKLEQELAELRAKLPPPVQALAAKPTLDQFDYDEMRFSEAYDKWMEQKSAQEAKDRAQLDAQRKEQEEVDNFKKSYAARKESLGVDDFEEAESEVGTILNQTQAGLLMRGADDPAVLVYALSKSPARLMDLAKITDPVKFTVAVAKMEISLATKKTNRPAPEPRINSERSSGFNSSNATLEKLRDEAARTGDATKVVEYKRKMGIK